MNIPDRLILSICIPSYNGLPRITRLIQSLLSSSRSDFEIIVSDDNSTDGTLGVLKDVIQSDSRISLFQNEVNLGMDLNFAEAVSKARGKYVWLCGQDDMILTEGVDVVLDTLIKNPTLDFLYLNHEMVSETFVPKRSSIINPTDCNENVYGVGLDSFLQMSGNELPSFLPKFLIRKRLWDASNAKRYFGTFYCQVGVFLESSSNIRWCHHGGYFVEGFLPSDGWQQTPARYVQIIIGYFIMLDRFYTDHQLTDSKIIKKQFNKHIKEFLYALLLVKRFGIKLDQELIKELLTGLRRHHFYFWIRLWNLKMPNFFWVTVWLLLRLKKLVR